MPFAAGLSRHPVASHAVGEVVDEVVDELLEPTGPSRPAVAGMFCAGEIGPVGGRSALFSFTASFTASIAVFTDLSTPDS